jgi:cysteine desulfurase
MPRVYLDHNASTPVHPEVIQAMLPYFRESFGNPSSIHSFGREARTAVEESREGIARFLGVSPEEIVFTSGGTESDNLAIKGVAHARERPGHIITTRVEHHAVHRSCEALEREGWAVTYLGVDEHGLVDPGDVRRALRSETALISVMHANSEVGTIEPIEEIATVAREAGVPFHVDGVQSLGKLPYRPREVGLDLLAFSSHKIYGPKGVGALWIRRGTRMVGIQHGGDHERRRRAGTENVAGIVGFAKAVEVREREMADEAVRLRTLRDRLWEGILGRVQKVKLNGHPTRRLPSTLNVSFKGIESESLILGLDLKGIAVSAGSACSSGNLEPSYVLTAMAVPADLGMSAARFSLGRGTTEAEIEYVLEVLPGVVERLRAFSPVASRA